MYYQLAAKQGDIRSIRLLFDWYYYGKHVEESLEEAVKFLQIGAQIGDAECQSNLGYFYENGLGHLPVLSSKQSNITGLLLLKVTNERSKTWNLDIVCFIQMLKSSISERTIRSTAFDFTIDFQKSWR